MGLIYLVSLIAICISSPLFIPNRKQYEYTIIYLYIFYENKNIQSHLLSNEMFFFVFYRPLGERTSALERLLLEMARVAEIA